MNITSLKPGLIYLPKDATIPCFIQVAETGDCCVFHGVFTKGLEKFPDDWKFAFRIIINEPDIKRNCIEGPLASLHKNSAGPAKYYQLEIGTENYSVVSSDNFESMETIDIDEVKSLEQLQIWEMKHVFKRLSLEQTMK